MIESIIDEKIKRLKKTRKEILTSISEGKEYTDFDKKMMYLIDSELNLINKEKKGGKTYVKRNDTRRHSKK